MMKGVAVGMMNADFGKKLAALGVPSNARRIVIDIKAFEPVAIYYETFVESEQLDGMLDVVLEIVAHVRGSGVKE